MNPARPKISRREMLERILRCGAVKDRQYGRPIAVKLTKYELEKMFKRVV